MNEEITANKKYKDTLFRMLFKRKRELLTLYNALNGSHYTDTRRLTVTTLENAVYMGMKNDVSFIIGSTINLYEHQSTVNPNMPLRHLIYFAKQMSSYVDDSIYSSTLLKIPAPRFIVFYNGIRKQPERQILKLSDAYRIREDEPWLELKVQFININAGMSEEIKRSCRTLYGYCYFTDLVRRYRKWKNMSLDAAVDKAVMVCIKRGILKRFFIKMRTEMTGMPISIFEYDAEEELRKEYRHGRRDGERRGIRKGRKEGIAIGEARGEARGESKGKIIGMAQGISQSLINILESYGEVPDELKAEISGQKDINVLNNWHKISLNVSGVKEFREKTNL